MTGKLKLYSFQSEEKNPATPKAARKPSTRLCKITRSHRVSSRAGRGAASQSLSPRSETTHGTRFCSSNGHLPSGKNAVPFSAGLRGTDLHPNTPDGCRCRSRHRAVRSLLGHEALFHLPLRKAPKPFVAQGDRPQPHDVSLRKGTSRPPL